VPATFEPATTKLPELILPPEGFWNVRVTYVQSETEVFVRVTKDDQFEAFSQKLKNFYDHANLAPVQDPVVGGIYAVYFRNFWDRVEIVFDCKNGEYLEAKLFEISKKGVRKLP